MASWTVSDIPSQRGRSAIITGTGGLGLEDALALARAGAEVIIAGRNSAKGAKAVALIVSELPQATVRFEQVDLASLSSISDFGSRIASRHDHLDLLINNAAVMAPPKRLETSDHFELQFGTNYLGHYALTAALLPLLRKGRSSRVVSVSSVAARAGTIDFADLQALQNYQPMRAYAQSKLACLMFAFELQRRSDTQHWGVTSIAAHPGISRTDLLYNAPGRYSLQGLARSILWFLFQPVAQGALPTLFAATAPEAEQATTMALAAWAKRAGRLLRPEYHRRRRIARWRHGYGKSRRGWPEWPFPDLAPNALQGVAECISALEPATSAAPRLTEGLPLDCHDDRTSLRAFTRSHVELPGVLLARVTVMLRLSFVLIAMWFLAGQVLAASPAPVEGQRGMVVSDQALATEVGAEILRAGGNAVDAAVAVGYAQAVVNPCCGNLGGGGFMTLHLEDGRAVFIDFREAAPEAAGPNMFLDGEGQVIARASLEGWRAAGVPGTVAGLDSALSRFGTMKRADVMAPAIRLARNGFMLTRPDADVIVAGTPAFLADPTLAKNWLRNGEALKAGDRLVQPELAATLQGIADSGPDYFYKGPVAAAIVAASKRNGGLFSSEDFARYGARIGKPIECSYRGYDILTAAPSSAGGLAVCEILNILEFYPIGYLGFGSADTVHLMTEAMRHAFVDRNSAIGDPAFVANPVERLVSKDYAAAIRATIDPYRATPSVALSGITPPHEGTETTHFSVVDGAGNAVAFTFSLNAYFGARVMAPGTGFFLNDTMDDFTIKVGAPNMFGLVQGTANSIVAGKRPVSSMAPTIVLKDGKPFMVLGSPGGSRIITAVVETVIDVVDFGMTIQEAVNAPRVHAQWLPDILFAEPYSLSPDTIRALVERGHKVLLQKPWGAVEAILVGGTAAESGELPSFGDDSVRGETPRPRYRYGASDARRPAGAASAE